MEFFIDQLSLHNHIFQGAVVLYLLATVTYFLESTLLGHFEWSKKVSTTLFVGGVVLLVIWFVHRWSVSGRAPIRTRYESLILYCICVSLVYIGVEYLHRLRAMGILAAGLGAFLLIYAVLHRDLEMVHLPPALQSVWFVPHVVTYFFAYGALTIAAFMALGYQLFPQFTASREKAGEKIYFDLEELSYETTKFGFVFLTWGLIMGAVWAKFAWGDYWGWDPKENWALITWLIFLTILHVRYLPGWKGRRSTILTLVGYGAIIFTYLGMKYLPVAQSSLHVYQG